MGTGGLPKKQKSLCVPCVWWRIFLIVYVEKFGWINNIK
jgi:hypothetical protein